MCSFIMRGFAANLAEYLASKRALCCWIGAASGLLFLAAVGDWADPGIRPAVSLAAAVAGIALLFPRACSSMAMIDRTMRRAYYREAFELAEKHAGIGRWRFDRASQTQSWSAMLCRQHGVQSGVRADEGTLAVLSNHASDSEPFRFEIEIKRPDGSDGVLRIFARNQFDEHGNPAETYGVVIDVTSDYDQLQEAHAERQKAQKLANTDPLTGLPNRRNAMASLDQMIVQSRSYGTALSLVVLDLDHFKEINDQYGHQTGDDVLMRVAAIAKQMVRSEDIFARIGGEEFLWIMPGASPQDAQLSSERLRRVIEQRSGEGSIPGVTVSIGLAVSGAADCGLTLFARADAALYEAKNAGRNQIKLAA